jgi:hypothetical protein
VRRHDAYLDVRLRSAGQQCTDLTISRDARIDGRRPCDERNRALEVTHDRKELHPN